MIKRTKCIVASLLILAAVFYLVGCARQPVDGVGYNKDKIVIQYTPITSTFVTQYIMISGLLEEKLPQGVSIEWEMLQSGTAIREAVVAGHIDVACLNLPATILGLENDMPLVILSGAIIHAGIVYSANPDIQSLDDIGPDHKLALLTIGGVFDLALKFAAGDIFGNPNRFDSIMVSMQTAEMLATIESSDTLDVIVVGFPETLRANRIDKLTPIYDLSPIAIENNVGHLIVTNENFYNDNPVLVDAINEAFSEAVTFINENPVEAVRIVYPELYGEIDFDDLVAQIIASPPFYRISESAFDRIAELMYGVGMIPNPPQPFTNLQNYDSIPKVP